MAVKRKDDGDEDRPVSSLKKSCIVALGDEAQHVFVPEESPAPEDLTEAIRATNFTKDGSVRAASESRRLWTFVCQVEGCGQRFNRPCRLEYHMRRHNDEKPWVCTHSACNKAYPRKDHLQRHMESAHGTQARTFVCDWEGCGKTFVNNGRLKRHKDVHESKFYCTGYPPCKEVFRKQKTLDAHIKIQHLDVKPYQCAYIDEKTGEKCELGYQTENALRRHMANIHSGEKKEEGYFCMICVPPGTEAETVMNEAGEIVTVPRQPLSFLTRELLQVHLREVHPPKCPKCNGTFTSTHGLKMHMEIACADADTAPKFPCPEPDCGRMFNRKGNLNVHIRDVHGNKVRFFCKADAMRQSKHLDLQTWDGHDACDAGFKQKASLEQHIRTQHLNQENRKQKRKARKARKKEQPSTLTLLTGIGYEKERPVPCVIPGCEYRFTQKRDLRRHLLSADHRLSEQEVEDHMAEYDATSGEKFWIGGLEEPTSTFDSVEPSVPQTPFYMDQQPLLEGIEGYAKLAEVPHWFASAPLGEVSMWDVEEAEMDAVMGLEALPPAVRAHNWDME